MLTKLAIWYLRKRKVSVMIGFVTFRGSLQSDNKRAFLYDNTLNETKYFDQLGKSLDLPEGKFHFDRSGDE